MRKIRSRCSILKPPAGRTEHIEQREFVQWWRQNRSEIIYAIPNGGLRNRTVAAKMKAEGMLAGVWDLHVPALNLYIEMKTKVGKLSPAQKAFQKNVPGHTWIVGYGRDDAISKVREFLGG